MYGCEVKVDKSELLGLKYGLAWENLELCCLMLVKVKNDKRLKTKMNTKTTSDTVESLEHGH